MDLMMFGRQKESLVGPSEGPGPHFGKQGMRVGLKHCRGQDVFPLSGKARPTANPWKDYFFDRVGPVVVDLYANKSLVTARGKANRRRGRNTRWAIILHDL